MLVASSRDAHGAHTLPTAVFRADKICPWFGSFCLLYHCFICAGGRLFHLYYRKDILDSRNLPVPATWDDLLVTAQRLNGSDFNNDTQSDYALCLQLSGAFSDLDASVMINVVISQVTQVEVSVRSI